MDRRALIVYDSVHGNRAKVAEAIGGARDREVSPRRAGEVGTGGGQGRV